MIWEEPASEAGLRLEEETLRLTLGLAWSLSQLRVLREKETDYVMLNFKFEMSLAEAMSRCCPKFALI